MQLWRKILQYGRVLNYKRVLLIFQLAIFEMEQAQNISHVFHICILQKANVSFENYSMERFFSLEASVR